MAGSEKDCATDYNVSKKAVNEVQIAACKGWSEPCEYCDKRFCDWVQADEDICAQIPDKPGFCAIGLKNKKEATEVVSIVFDPHSVRNQTIAEMGKIRDQISNKKSKATKSTVQVRWMVVRRPEDKENSVLCAHWQNNGVLPRFLREWPGNNLLQKSDFVELSQQTQKWCYPQKVPVWRKPKPAFSKILEVPKCTMPEACRTCDSYFSPWKPLVDVFEKNSAPDYQGTVMLSVVCGKKREISEISYSKSVKSTVEHVYDYKYFHQYVRHHVNKNPKLEVRWSIFSDSGSDSCCFLYAHWLNAGVFYYGGEGHLNSNKHFVYRTNEKMWFYEIEAFKQTKFSKVKNRRKMLEEMADEKYDIED